MRQIASFFRNSALSNFLTNLSYALLVAGRPTLLGRDPRESDRFVMNYLVHVLEGAQWVNYVGMSPILASALLGICRLGGTEDIVKRVPKMY
jgi:hypothetical protein